MWHPPQGDKYVAHPDASLPMPVNWEPKRYWIYQDTLLDLESLKPVLHDAFSVAGIPLMDEPNRRHRNAERLQQKLS